MNFQNKSWALKGFLTSTLWLFVINLLGLLKNKPSLIIYQMQIDGQKVLAFFYEILQIKRKLGIKGLMFLTSTLSTLPDESARIVEK